MIEHDVQTGRGAGTGWLLVLVASGLLALAVSVGITAVVQQRAAHDATQQSAAAQRMLIAMLDQETGVRGYGLNGRREFLEPFTTGKADFASALADARAGIQGDDYAQSSLAEQAEIARRWRALAQAALPALQRRGDVFAEPSPARERKAVMDQFRASNAQYQRLIDERREDRERRLAWLSAFIVLAMAVFFAGVGALILRRQRRDRRRARAVERVYVSRQHDLGVGLQVARSDEEAHEVLRRHLELSVPGSDAVVLVRNNSANRLQPGTDLPPESPLEARLAEAEPRDCLAVRLASRRHHGDDVADSVLECAVCGRLGAQADCSPLVVGGEVIGSVLVTHPETLTGREDRAVEESVGQAAPVLANLRNLALAESRAATDGLTGLPNRRAFDEALKRMAAQAGRSATPLAAIALDLDHFKSVNDTYGHDQGDEVLAAVGALLRDVIRASDFAARTGGEEFVVLAPDTGAEGGVALAETIRAAVRELSLPGLPPLTVSVGVAALPDDATTPSGLLRAADRLLYVAKDHGRDRVESTTPAAGTRRREDRPAASPAE
ncbi:MAG: diguanylate cyclase [Solirubrobacteraceae bacterium]|nr:diguanylate cyclase [Solirubrobacteraceae bacterium]